MRHMFCALAVLVLLGLLPAATYDGARADRGHRLDVLTQAETLEEMQKLVRRNYYESTDPVDLYHGAIKGYLAGLDPHSTYIPPDALRDAQERLSGSFEGIGIYFDVIGGYLTVISPIEGSPAYEAGLLAGDRIVKIDSRSALNIKADEVARRLKGPRGSQVKVDVQRLGENETRAYEITRDKVEVPSVRYAFMATPDVGYVRLAKFAAHTSSELRTAIQDLLDEGAKKLILDLRDNGGGYLEQAVAVASLFIEKDALLVYTEGRLAKSREDHHSTSDPILPEDMPLMVMVNSFSASASEIVAGAVQDYDRGLVVGRTTFGKGLVQKQYSLKNGGAVLLTVARYFTPSERPIQRPFSDDREGYQIAGHDNYDPNADPDSLASRPIYYTRILKRKVYGSGGITPDVALRPDSLGAFARKLQRQHFFDFANRASAYAIENYPTLEAFLKGYTPGRRMLGRFKTFLKDEGIEFSERDFRDATRYIRRVLKQRIAEIQWGLPAGGRVQVSQDPQVEQALALFGRAASLLASRTSKVDRERTYVPGAGGSGHRRIH